MSFLAKSTMSVWMNRGTTTLVLVGVLVGLLFTLAEYLSAVSITPLGDVVSVVALAVLLLSAPAIARTAPEWFVIVLVGVAVRLPYLVLYPVNDDSPIYVGIASDMAAGEFAFTGHFAVELIMALFVLLYESSGGNIASFIAAIATIPVVGLVGRALFDSRRVGLASALLFALTPIHIWYSSWAYTEPIALLFFAITLYLYLTNHLWAGTLVTCAILLMRLEYAVLILLPLLVLLLLRKSSFFVPVIATQPLAYAGCLAGVLLFPDAARTLLIKLADVLSVGLFSDYFLIQFAEAPMQVVRTNVLSRGWHFFHWGVPYWDLRLVNPFLPVFFLVGLGALVPRDRFKPTILLIATAFPAAGFAYSNVLARLGFIPNPVRGLVPLVALAVGVAFGYLVLIYVIVRGDRWVVIPLLATLPYLALLVIAWPGARYLLPISVVFVVYAGSGLVFVYDYAFKGFLHSREIRLPFGI